MIPLKQSTASQEIPLGVFVDDADGKTAETGLTIANTDIKVWKAGATSLASKNSGGATHIAGGIYYAVLDATDTDTIGPLVIFIHVAGALPVRLECCVYAANVYDSLIAGSDKLEVDTVEISSDSGAADNAETAFDGGSYNVGGGAVVAASVTAGVALTSGERNSVADALLNRDMSTGTDTGSETVRTVRQALRFLRNKWSITGTTLTVTKEDDTAASWTASVTTNASADPITGSDPASS
jgi:hypothetical protein